MDSVLPRYLPVVGLRVEVDSTWLSRYAAIAATRPTINQIALVLVIMFSQALRRALSIPMVANWKIHRNTRTASNEGANDSYGKGIHGQ